MRIFWMWKYGVCTCPKGLDCFSLLPVDHCCWGRIAIQHAKEHNTLRVCTQSVTSPVLLVKVF